MTVAVYALQWTRGHADLAGDLLQLNLSSYETQKQPIFRVTSRSATLPVQTPTKLRRSGPETHDLKRRSDGHGTFRLKFVTKVRLTMAEPNVSLGHGSYGSSPSARRSREGHPMVGGQGRRRSPARW